MITRNLLCVLVASGCFLAGAVEVPVPIVTETGAKEGAAALLNKGEAALACEVKFGSLPSKGEVTGLFRLEADADGYVTLTIPAAPTAIEGDLAMRSRVRVGSGEWHQYAFSFSMLRRRAAYPVAVTVGL